jgi:sigma-B regulation protein RsbU (phosphoserine phosphatase)
MDLENNFNNRILLENFEDFFENSLCGYSFINPQGEIIRSNARLASWIGCTAQELTGKRFSDLLSFGGKIYYETHLWPLLRIQGFFDEIALELVTLNDQKYHVLINGYERRDENQNPLFVGITIFKATDRRLYEKTLSEAKETAQRQLLNERKMSVLHEQFIAVLGHDLRNPLGAINGGIELLSRSSLSEDQGRVIRMMKNSSLRIGELIENVMDFARIRMGGGLIVNKQQLVRPEPIILQIVDEFRLAWSRRTIEAELDSRDFVTCDPARISQLLSNLIANALTHGSPDEPVYVRSRSDGNVFELSISNKGKPIPQEFIEKLFQPYTREEDRASRNGLGLGLYIASEIARAHHGELSVFSTLDETRFTFKMMIDK